MSRRTLAQKAGQNGEENARIPRTSRHRRTRACPTHGTGTPVRGGANAVDIGQSENRRNDSCWSRRHAAAPPLRKCRPSWRIGVPEEDPKKNEEDIRRWKLEEDANISDWLQRTRFRLPLTLLRPCVPYRNGSVRGSPKDNCAPVRCRSSESEAPRCGNPAGGSAAVESQRSQVEGEIAGKARYCSENQAPVVGIPRNRQPDSGPDSHSIPLRLSRFSRVS